MRSRGVCFVVYGETAEFEYQQAREVLRRHNLPIFVQRSRVESFGPLSDMQQSRYAKVSTMAWSPFTDTLYLDADTRVLGDLKAGWGALCHGWDIAITPSQNQGHDWLWHVGEDERKYTREALGFEPLQLQAGVFFVRRSPATSQLFSRWRNEWLRFKGQDQAALLRALYALPVNVYLLSRHFNDGAVISHRWGAIRK